ALIGASADPARMLWLLLGLALLSVLAALPALQARPDPAPQT
ncbi:unnamed protein product, partial [Laminaria digitata]